MDTKFPGDFNSLPLFIAKIIWLLDRSIFLPDYPGQFLAIDGPYEVAGISSDQGWGEATNTLLAVA